MFLIVLIHLCMCECLSIKLKNVLSNTNGIVMYVL